LATVPSNEQCEVADLSLLYLQGNLILQELFPTNEQKGINGLPTDFNQCWLATVSNQRTV
jgi:hypothetical protein